MSESIATTASVVASVRGKLCGHVIKGECNFGDVCPNYHPVDAQQARAIYAAADVKTFDLCAGRTECVTPGCALLHVGVVSKGSPPLPRAKKGAAATAAVAAPRVAHVIAGRIPPTGIVPARPAVARTNATGRGAQQAPTRHQARVNNARPISDLMRALRRIRGKIFAIERASDAFQTLTSTVGSADAAQKVADAKRMKSHMMDALEMFSRSLDEYIHDLGASEADHDDSSDSE